MSEERENLVLGVGDGCVCVCVNGGNESWNKKERQGKIVGRGVM